MIAALLILSFAVGIAVGVLSRGIHIYHYPDHKSTQVGFESHNPESEITKVVSPTNLKYTSFPTDEV